MPSPPAVNSPSGATAAAHDGSIVHDASSTCIVPSCSLVFWPVPALVVSPKPTTRTSAPATSPFAVQLAAIARGLAFDGWSSTSTPTSYSCCQSGYAVADLTLMTSPPGCV